MLVLGVYGNGMKKTFHFLGVALLRVPGINLWIRGMLGVQLSEADGCSVFMC